MQAAAKVFLAAIHNVCHDAARASHVLHMHSTWDVLIYCLPPLVCEPVYALCSCDAPLWYLDLLAEGHVALEHALLDRLLATERLSSVTCCRLDGTSAPAPPPASARLGLPSRFPLDLLLRHEQQGSRGTRWMVQQTVQNKMTHGVRFSEENVLWEERLLQMQLPLPAACERPPKPSAGSLPCSRRLMSRISFD